MCVNYQVGDMILAAEDIWPVGSRHEGVPAASKGDCLRVTQINSTVWPVVVVNMHYSGSSAFGVELDEVRLCD